MKNGSLLIFLLLVLNLLHSCKSTAADPYAHILETKNISIIEDFLANAHEQDPRRTVLRQRVIALKNAALKKNASKAKQMSARPIFTELSKKVNLNSKEESEEFTNLMAKKSTLDHQQKTVQLLNTLFDQDISSKEAILLVQNNSDCNMILRLQGKAFYNLAIPTRGENSLVIPKGDYTLSSNVCDVQYSSHKKIDKNTMVTLNSPRLNNSIGSNIPTAKSQQ